jgi:hypothetical protein
MKNMTRATPKSQIADSLRKTQTVLPQRVFEDQDLGHTLGPAATLKDEVIEGFRRQAHAHRFVEIDAVVSLAVEHQRGLRVLGNRVAGDAPDFHEVLPAQKRR